MRKVNITLSIGSSHGWQFGKGWQGSARGKDIIRRFWRNVQPTEGCWFWTGHVTDRGYGSLGGRQARIKAHRLSWLIHYGSIPDGMVVCHSCDVPRCVNPEHLRLDTQAGNLHESVRKGRKDCWGLQKLTADQVRAIRERVAAGELQYRVAADFGISRNHVSGIVNRKSWAHLDESHRSTAPVHQRARHVASLQRAISAQKGEKVPCTI